MVNLYETVIYLPGTDNPPRDDWAGTLFSLIYSNYDMLAAYGREYDFPMYEHSCGILDPDGKSPCTSLPCYGTAPGFKMWSIHQWRAATGVPDAYFSKTDLYRYPATVKLSPTIK